MSEHTPGPWTLDEDWMLIKGPKGEEVAAIHPATPSDTKRVNRNIAWDNGALIASSPNLLEVLKDLQVWLIHPDLSKSTLRFMHQRIKSAIAKAEGTR